MARQCVRRERRDTDPGASLRSQKTLQRGADGKFKDSVKYRLLSDYYKGTQRQEKGINTFTSIISMKLTNSRYKVYSQNGILINVVDFSDLTKKYGSPIAVSPDGLNFIFKKSEDEIDLRRKSTKDVTATELIQDHFTLSVMSLSIFGLCHIKDINVYDAVKEYVRTAAGDRGDKALRAFEKKYSWLFTKDYDTVLEKCRLSIKISDKLDVCVQIKSKPATQAYTPSTYNQLQPQGALDGLAQ